MKKISSKILFIPAMAAVALILCITCILAAFDSSKHKDGNEFEGESNSPNGYYL